MNLRQHCLKNLARASTLEGRLRRLAEPVVELSDDHLLQLLDEYAETVRQAPEGGRMHLLDNMVEPIEGVARREFSGRLRHHLSLRQTTQLRIVQYLFRSIEDQRSIHPKMVRVLQPLEVAFARALIAEPAGFFDHRHPLRELFEALLRVAKGFDDSSGARAQQIPEEIERTVLSLLLPGGSTRWACSEAARGFLGFMDEYNQALHLYEQRHIDKERGQILLGEVRNFVHSAIEETVAERQIPDFVLAFLHEVWSKYLYIGFLRNGIQDAAWWNQGIRDMQDLVASVVTRNPEILSRGLAGGLGLALQRIRRNAEGVHDQGSTEGFFNQLQGFYDGIRERRTFDTEMFGRAHYGRAEPVTSLDEAGRPVPQEVEQAAAGSWYRLSQRGLIVRSKLIEKNPRHRYMLFTNYSGLLTARLRFSEFAEQVRIGYIEPIDTQPEFERLLRTALESLEHYLGELAGDVTRREQQREVEREVELKLRLEEEERRAAEARREAMRRAEEEARKAQENALNQAVSEAEKLQPGGMLEFLDGSGNAQVCALALKLKKTRKMVFVDRNGRKVAEYHVQELGERILDGSASIIDYGTTFDKTLESLRWTRHADAEAQYG